ncbi:MAG: ABC transporter permease subunit [Lachnospiraceae bacterium]|nr:ABC transporter permease subunit [Lachnospiraceae bacterium]
MKSLSAFTKKEFLELTRTGKLLILSILFILFGIMNPAIAKLTPWLMEMAFQDIPKAALLLSQIEINALTAWTQFYKNIPLALIVLLLVFSSILTSEYQKGTLINMVTKGLARWKIIAAKSFTAVSLWTLGYWICFGITYGYSAYYWDNRIASHLFFSALCFYLLGMWLISLLFLLSSLLSSNSSVLLISGGIFLGVYLLGFLPDIKEYLPGYLMNSKELLTSGTEPSAYFCGIAVTILLSLLNYVLATVCFNRRML